MRAHQPPRHAPLDVRTRVAIAICFIGVVVSGFALLVAIPLAFAWRGARRALVWAALAGLLLSALFAPLALGQADAALQAFVDSAARVDHPHRHLHRHGQRRHRHRHHHRGRHRHIHRNRRGGGEERDRPPRLPDWGASASAAWPHVVRWWLWLLPAAPVLALALNVVRPRTLVEEQRRSEHSLERTLERRRDRAARRAARLAAPERAPTLGREPGIALLGAKVSGEPVLPERRGAVGLPLEWLHRPTLVIGPSGSGKTVTLERLGYGAAAVGRWPVYYIDAKGDRENARRFAGLMASAGLRTAVFPDVPIDCWRGDGRALANRLIELVPFSTEGDGAFYRDVAKRCLWLACCGAAEPPRTSAELLERLKPDSLLALDAGRGELAKLGQRDLAGVALRYASFFDSLQGALDGGGFGFEDIDSAYLMLDGLALKEDAQSLARLLIEDFAHFATQRKPRSQPALLIIDEISAIADAARIVDLVERLRSFNVGVVLAPQVEAGLGGDDAISDRIVQNAETLIVHALKRPERIIEMAGTRRELEASYQHERGTGTGMGTGRAQHVFKVDPNEVRGLRPGECFVIRGGRQARVQVARAPVVPMPRLSGAEMHAPVTRPPLEPPANPNLRL